MTASITQRGLLLGAFVLSGCMGAKHDGDSQGQGEVSVDEEAITNGTLVANNTVPYSAIVALRFSPDVPMAPQCTATAIGYRPRTT